MARKKQPIDPSRLPEETTTKPTAITAQPPENARAAVISQLFNTQRVQETLAKVLPKHLTPEKILTMYLIAASRQPKLYECTGASILKAAVAAAELGLDFSGKLGEGWLVPFHNKNIGAYECTFIPGYQGLVKLVRNSGEVVQVRARLVHERDMFEVSYGLDETITHVLSREAEAGDVTHVYAVAVFKDGSHQFEVMTIQEVEAVRARSRAATSGPWVTDWGEMAKKTVVRRMFKYLPRSPELEKFIAVDNEGYDLRPVAAEITGQTQAGVAALTKRLQQRQALAPPADEPEMPAPDEPYVSDTETAPPTDEDFDEAPAPQREPGEDTPW